MPPSASRGSESVRRFPQPHQRPVARVANLDFESNLDECGGPISAALLAATFSDMTTPIAQPIRIRLLGDFSVTVDDRIVTGLSTTRLRSLIGYLVLRRGKPQLRAHVAFCFWPDSSEQQALTNLRHLLHELRQALPEAARLLKADSRTVVWNVDCACAVDIADFEHEISVAQEATQRGDRSTTKAALQRAVLAYQGELLPGCDGEWVETERARLRQTFSSALEQLVTLHEESRDYHAAIRDAQRLRQLDPTRESTSCTLMHLQMLAGDRASALQTYEQCVATLQRELNVGPGKKLRRLREEVLVENSASAGAAPMSDVSGAPEYALRGRDNEWRTLRAAWKEAAVGRAGMVAILGEAGIGKSRLAEELCVWVERQGGVVARTRSYSAEGRLAYAPAAQWLRSPLVRKKIAVLDAVWLQEVMRIVPELRFEHPEITGPGTFNERSQRHHLFEGLSRAVLASGGPLLLCLDDMQWTDQETLEWLRYLMRFAPAARLLVISTVRSEELGSQEPLQHLFDSLRRDDQLTEIELPPLSEAEAAAVACDVAGRELGPAERKILYAQTEGNPLFVVESVRAGWPSESEDEAESSDRTFGRAGSQIPPKVHAVITTRLTQLSDTARELAGVAAVIGRAFTFEVLVAVCARPEAELVAAFEELWRRRIVRELSNGAYDFTHDKIRDVAYEEIVSVRRRMLHRRVAEVLEKGEAGDLDAVRAQIAAHLAESGQKVAAIAAYQRAAAAAKDLHASEEAIRLFKKALGLLALLPENSERAAQELALNTELGVCFVSSRGYPASDVWHVYERALELCGQLNRPTAPPILRGLAIASIVSGDLTRAYSLGEELLRHFDQQHDPVTAVEGHYVLGVTCFWLGRFVESRTHLEEALTRYDPSCRHLHIAYYAQDPKAVCLCRLAWTLWYLGDSQRSIAIINDALVFAPTLGHPHTEGYVLYFAAQLAYELRDETRVRELLAGLERLTRRYRLTYWEERGHILSSLLRASERGAADTAARTAMAASAREGDMVNFIQYLGYAANLCLRQRSVHEGRAAIAEAFKLMKRSDERYYCAELHRLDGELQLLSGTQAGPAEVCFREALRVAREQGAKALELRAAISLGRLWLHEGKTGPALSLLQDVYAAFENQSPSVDSEEARTLLAALHTRESNTIST